MRTLLSRRASALGPQPVNDLNTVLHLTEHRMIRPATLRLPHHLFPIILYFSRRILPSSYRTSTSSPTEIFAFSRTSSGMVTWYLRATFTIKPLTTILLGE